MLNLLSVREQVYEYLKSMINSGELKSGESVDIKLLAEKFGISKTPLRDALLQLEVDGFVKIMPRKGIVVASLTLEDIKNYYEIIASAESFIVQKYGHKLTENQIEQMRQFNLNMKEALNNNDFNGYYENNINFHNIYINLTDNKNMLKILKISKERLYDFPRKKEFIKDWELDSVLEHDNMIILLKNKKFKEAADYIREVHWSYEYQHKYILKYYTENV
jgi:DNA-binding GntR family transcriptional regulator